MNKAFIALGTNIEPRKEYLDQAIQLLSKVEDVQIIKKSSIYQTPPVGYTNQADFLNMVLEISTRLSSEQLLDQCQEIENELGRKRTIRFGPRTIDLDILVFNEENIKTERLTIPHPRMDIRAFVLVPLNELAPELRISGLGKTVKQLLHGLPDQDKKDITKWKMVESEEE
ncbi:2-amino-4-hydroxy-6-hydroxymethyldihydropteridine diphosphokinase [Paucisalibacillus globulus]|jgi:2-amino-4-hydroxy-6-hydroxymethyldihydropteridine diphosphokinase|uniref:2-amino-4-hydroxy-6- hydroxymethyldihydropteridine diphosphokinase n=1 Tax=Paucisalibacillus globulus TaxID=351095 RepID=UPI000BB9ADDA|nr:2-amino-4-hydroxy-6-hydroxymethyldihydropteridine diphosphokinase [Paucisalibacillus globulus]